MASEWIAVMDKLPDAQKAVLRDNDPPAKYDDMASNDNWIQIFTVWSQFASARHVKHYTPLSSFYRWARENWGAESSGEIFRMASVPEIAEANEKWFTYGLTGVTSDLTDAAKGAASFLEDVEDPANPTAEELNNAQPVAKAMVEAAVTVIGEIYESFKEDIEGFGETAATQGAQFEAGYIDALHARNKTNIEGLDDKEYFEVNVYKWAGNTLVLLGTHPKTTIMDIGAQNLVHETEIAKKKAAFGPGEFICVDPGAYLADIQREISDFCGSKKPVKKGPIPDSYHLA